MAAFISPSVLEAAHTAAGKETEIKNRIRITKEMTPLICDVKVLSVYFIMKTSFSGFFDFME